MSKRTSETRRRGLLGRLGHDRRGGIAVEFALVAPLVILLTVAIFEMVLLLLDFQNAAEAARRGVRMALITPTIAELGGLEGAGTIACTYAGESASCSGASVVSNAVADASFAEILAGMQDVMPTLAGANIRLTYTWSTVDDTAAAPTIVTPLVTMDLVNVTHDILWLSYFAGLPTQISMPSFSSSRLAHSRIP